MLKFIKRLTGGAPAEPVRPVRRTSSRRSSRDYSAPMPLPEVTEGDDESSWSMWNDSMNSELHGLERSESSYMDTVPSRLDDLDPFSRVGKNRDA